MRDVFSGDGLREDNVKGGFLDLWTQLEEKFVVFDPWTQLEEECADPTQ